LKIYRIAQSLFYHGSYYDLPYGTVLTPKKGNFVNNISDDSHFKLEQFRPSQYISRNEAVYMCDNPDDIDLAGGSTDYIYIVEPLGTIEKHDLNWMTEINLIMDKYFEQGNPEDAVEEVEVAALNYWNGVSHYNESVWEYLTTSARILNKNEDI
jgi:hypothetical protein